LKNSLNRKSRIQAQARLSAYPYFLKEFQRDKVTRCLYILSVLCRKGAKNAIIPFFDKLSARVNKRRANRANSYEIKIAENPFWLQVLFLNVLFVSFLLSHFNTSIYPTMVEAGNKTPALRISFNFYLNGKEILSKIFRFRTEGV